MPSVPDHSKHLTKAGPDKAQMTCVIIMPIHNEGAHLERVLTSYINQIHRPDQLILVNDGSTDQYTETEVTYEDGRKGQITATLEMRDVTVVGALGVAAE